MDKEIHPGIEISFLLFLGLFVFLPPMVWAGETPTRVIEEAKFAIDQARKAGAPNGRRMIIFLRPSPGFSAPKRNTARPDHFSPG